MFQLEAKPKEALKTALEIKTKIKQIKGLDVRIAIGIGTGEHKTDKIKESNGSAYSNSGICFENLKKRRLAIKTPCEKFDKDWNLSFRLLSLTIDGWTPTGAKIIEEALKNKNLNQKALAKKLKKTQSTISKSLNQSGYNEVNLLINHFIVKLEQLKNKTQE